MTSQITIGNVKIDNLSLEETLRKVEHLIRLNEPCYITPVNVDIVMRCNKDDEYAQFYKCSKLSITDGMPIIWASKFLGTPIQRRISGCELVVSICDLAHRRGFKVFFLGGRPGAAQRAKHTLKQRFKGLSIDTYCPPYDYEKYDCEVQKIFDTVMATKPDILFVGLGSPKREKFIKEYYRPLGVPVSMGVGAAFEWIGGQFKRAPLWMQNHGLEWFWRLGLEPGRLWKRYLVDDMPFFGLVYRQRGEINKGLIRSK